MPEIINIAVFVFALVMVYLWLWTIGFVYNDAIDRGFNGLLWSLLVVLGGWPLTFVLWIVFRPKLQDKKRRRV